MLMKLKFYGTTFDFKLIFGYEQIGAGQWPLCQVKACPKCPPQPKGVAL